MASLKYKDENGEWEKVGFGKLPKVTPAQIGAAELGEDGKVLPEQLPEVTPADIGAVSKSGDTMSGALGFGGQGQIVTHTDGANWNSICVEAINKTGGVSRLAVFSNDPTTNGNAMLQAYDGSGNLIKDEVILHTGNKDVLFTYGTADLTAGTSPLETGKLYFVYE